MGYEDRSYFRDRGNASFNPLNWLLYGTVPLFTAFDINVRCHASLILTAVLILLFGWGPGFGWQDSVGSMIVLFAIVLLHEFGHCFTARWVGGDAEEIVMHPLGGLALCRPPRRPLPTFLTVAGGPAVNVIICLVCGLILLATTHALPANPFNPRPLVHFNGWTNIRWCTFWIYQTSYTLLIFNLMPIFPLDGGQMLQAALWKPLGYRKSMLFACITGMIAAAIGGMIALATFNIGLAVLAGLGFYVCFQTRRMVIYQSMGDEEFDGGIDYSAAYDINAGRTPKQKRGIKWFQKVEREEAAERARIDVILEKVSAKGMNSLTRGERRALQKATDRQRKRDLEMGRRVR